MKIRMLALVILALAVGGCVIAPANSAGDREAARWMGYAAEEGNAYGLFNYGQCCLFGDGVAQDREMGIRYLRMAAERGSPEALEILREAGVDTEPVK